MSSFGGYECVVEYCFIVCVYIYLLRVYFLNIVLTCGVIHYCKAAKVISYLYTVAKVGGGWH